ncbi:hypothetical protein EJB05_01607 [Eragrostis curvula]|uniref:DUF8039 domain-containing protein n=1 Tax=Eragrostis curvula TaxID=38414 RepID=A0A5J9WQ07_9POAL|nr:hypothetical protein EJB05_01607 [Eragrostis curvula]
MGEDAVVDLVGSPKADYQLPSAQCVTNYQDAVVDLVGSRKVDLVGRGSDGEGSPFNESPSPPCTKRQRIERINPNYKPADEIEMPRRSNRQRLIVEEEIAAVVPSEQVPEEQRISKRGKRKKNKLHGGIHRVTAITKSGKPIAPKGILAMWRNDCGVIVRQYGKIIWDNWLMVDPKEKESLWSKLNASYIFPDEFLEKGKNATIKTMGKCLRTFRHNLDKLYIKQGRTPKDYGFISRDEWNIFVRQRTSEKALVRSKAFQDLNQMNKFPHNLGPGGYVVQIPKWREEEEKEREAGLPDQYEGCNERTRNWAKARSKKSSDGKLVPNSSAVSEVVQKAKVVGVKAKEGKIQLNGPNDQLTVSLENAEHRGRTRAVDSIAPWSEGFPEGATCSTANEDAEFQKWSQFFWRSYQQNPNLVQAMEVPEVRLSVDSEQQPSTQCFAPSSVGSTPVDTDRYPVDKIKEDTPCSLLLPYGRKGRTKMVAEGIAMVGRVMHTRAILAECARVQVLRVVDDKYNTVELDYPNEDEEFETLGDAVNNFILWPRKDIVIHMLNKTVDALTHHTASSPPKDSSQGAGEATADASKRKASDTGGIDSSVLKKKKITETAGPELAVESEKLWAEVEQVMNKHKMEASISINNRDQPSDGRFDTQGPVSIPTLAGTPLSRYIDYARRDLERFQSHIQKRPFNKDDVISEIDANMDLWGTWFKPPPPEIQKLMDGFSALREALTHDSQASAADVAAERDEMGRQTNAIKASYDSVSAACSSMVQITKGFEEQLTSQDCRLRQYSAHIQELQAKIAELSAQLKQAEGDFNRESLVKENTTSCLARHNERLEKTIALQSDLEASSTQSNEQLKKFDEDLVHLSDQDDEGLTRQVRCLIDFFMTCSFES